MPDYEEEALREYYESIEDENRKMMEDICRIDWERRRELIAELESIDWTTSE
jgi:hypothetical protein